MSITTLLDSMMLHGGNSDKEKLDWLVGELIKLAPAEKSEQCDQIKQRIDMGNIVFLKDCAVDGCYKKNIGDGYQMCKKHQEMYDRGEKLIAFYGKVVQKQSQQAVGDLKKTDDPKDE